MALIELGTLRDYWKNVSDWVKGIDVVSSPKITISSALPVGTNLMGKIGIDQTTLGVTNGVSVVNTVQVDLATGLMYQNDSVTVSRVAKGAVTQVFTDVIVSGQSALIDCTGFNALMVGIQVSDSPVTGMDLQVNGLTTLDTGTQTYWANIMDVSGVIMQTNGIKQNIVRSYRGVPDKVFLNLIRTDGTFNIFVQPVNL